MKPRLFVASSVERLDLAHAVQKNLEHDAEITVWNQGVFKPSAFALESLIEQLETTDFGLFVFADDDVTNKRGKSSRTVRDNVIFELGLFVGRLGRTRTFFLIPRDVKNLTIPTDLWGINPLNFDPNRSDNNLIAALGPACNDVRIEIKRLGKLINSSLSAPSDTITVCSAIWGSEEFWTDVTDILMTKMLRGERDIQATRDVFGDPAPYRSKKLVVSYTHHNQKGLKIVPENEKLILPDE